MRLARALAVTVATGMAMSTSGVAGAATLDGSDPTGGLVGPQQEPVAIAAGPLDTLSDLDAALAFEDRLLDHYHYGQVHEQYYNTAERIPGDIATLVGENDSALYTGNYLAAESFRYALALAKLDDLYARRDAGEAGLPAGYGAALARARGIDGSHADAGNGYGLGVDPHGDEPDALDDLIAQWEWERDDAKSRVDTTVAQFHILTNISENWHENPDLALGGKSVVTGECDADWSGTNQPDNTGVDDECDQTLPEELANDLADGEYEEGAYVDYGGGVITGGDTPVNAPQPGLLFRYCSPVDAPYAFNAGRNPDYNRLAANLPWDNDGDGTIEDGEAQHCIGATSRDAYAGVTFGLTTALDMVGPHDPELQALVAHDIMAMTDYAVRYYWTQPRSHGDVVIPELWGGNTLDGGYQADLFFQVPLHRLNMIQIAKHASYVAGTPEQQTRYEAIWAEEVALETPQLMGEMVIDDFQPRSAYYKFHLHHMTGFNLIRLEDDPVLRAEFARGFGVMDRETRSHKNAFYEGLTFALTGELDRLDDAVAHHREWLDYYDRQHDYDNFVPTIDLCGIEFTCVPDWSAPVTVTLGGQETTIDYGTYQALLDAGEAALTGNEVKEPPLRAEFPLPVKYRRSGDFMWQKNPWALDRGPNDRRYSAPGADFLTPYWMIRYYSEVAPPPVRPFDTPPTPVFE